MVIETDRIRPKLPLSIKFIVIVFILYLVATMVTQGLTVVDYDSALKLGFAEDDPADPDRFVRGRAVLEEGLAYADVIVQGIFLLGAIVGLSIRRPFGYAFAIGALAIIIYWPAFNIFQDVMLSANGFSDRPMTARLIFLPAAVVAAVAIGIVLYRNRRLFNSNNCP